MSEIDWRPFCGALYPLERVAGDPVVCTNPPHDIATVKHHHDETGFEWWGDDNTIPV